MKTDVTEYVSTYFTCQKVKAEYKKVVGLLQPLPVLYWKWAKVTMDFVTRLPLTRTKRDVIWVVFDRLTKSAHFIPVNVKDSMEKLTKTYTQQVARLHGVSSSIVSDRDPRFTSRFWKSFQELIGTTLKLVLRHILKLTGNQNELFKCWRICSELVRWILEMNG
jgi:hypothetical protein